MKHNIKTNALRLAMALMAFLTIGAANAENRLYIENFTLNSTAPKRVAVLLDNADEVAALQCYVVAPQGVTIVDGFERNDARFATGQNPSYRVQGNGSSAVLMVTSARKNNFIGNSGAIGWITVQADAAALENGMNGTLSLKDIILSSGAGKQLEAESSTNTSVALQDGTATLSAGKGFVINPGDTHKVSLSVTNDFAVRGMSVNIVVPEGFSILNDEVFKGDRLSNGAFISVTKRSDNVTYGISIYDLASDDPVFGIGSGDVLTFDVVAPENFSDATATIMFTEPVFSNTKNRALYAEGTSVVMTNGITAYNKAMGVVAALEGEFDKALAQIAESAPNVKDLFQGEDIRTAIENLRNAIESAYADGTLTGNYDSVMSPVQEIRDAIGKLVVDALQAEQEYKDTLALNEALTKANAEISALRQKLSDTMSQISQVAPDVKDNFNGDDITAMIDALQNSVNKAFENKTLVADYETVMSIVPSIRAAMDKLLSDAKDAQKVFEENARVAANKAAYEADLAKIAALQTLLDNTVAGLKTSCPDVDTTEEVAKLQALIDAEKTKAAAALEAVKEEGKYTNTVDAEGVENAISKFKADTEAEQARINAERDRVAANKAAYEADLAKIAALQTLLDNTVAGLKTSCPDVDTTEEVAKLQALIDAEKTKAAAALEAVKEEGKYTNTVDAEGVENAISKFKADTEAEQARINAERDRVAANKAAYEADLAKIVALESSLNVTVTALKASCPDVDVNEMAQTVRNLLQAERDKAAAALAAVKDEGTYSNVVDESSIEEAIQTLIKDANAAQAAIDAERARVAANEAAYQADLNIIQKLQDNLDETVERLKAEYPGADITEAFEAAQAAIDAEKEKADAEFESVKEEGVYSNVVNVVGIEKLIQAVVDAAVASGVEDIYMDLEEAGVRIFTLDGKSIPALQRGKVNIIVKTDGTVRKMYVK